MGERKIIHIDMDAFFAAAEQRDNPDLRGKPIVVGFDGPRGVVSTASYEARPFGVHSAMSISMAKRLCPQLVIVPPHFEFYRSLSHQIRSILQEYTDMIEPLSIDEAFLDVTVNKKNMPFARDIAMEIKREIRERTSLVASAGVSYNKFLAKIASDYRKPDGLFVIPPSRALDFIAQLRIEDFWGVGPKTTERMHTMGIFNGAQLRSVSLGHLTDVFGKAGAIYYNFSRGIDDREVTVERERKSVGCERTFLQDISVQSTILIELYHIVLELEGRLARANFDGKTLTLKVKYYDFSQITRSVTSNRVLKTKDDILPLAKDILRRVHYSADKPVRLIGLAVSNHSGEEAGQLSTWTEGFLPFHE